MKSEFVKGRQIIKTHSCVDIPAFIKKTFAACILTGLFCFTNAQAIDGFSATGQFNEQEMTIDHQWKNVIIDINAPMQFHPDGKAYLIFYTLPNGNTIAWTKGKQIGPGEDWHFDIQHIAAQTRFIRNTDKKNNYIIAYRAAAQKSWPTWKRTTPDSLHIIKNIVDSVTNIFTSLHPFVILSSHSGGGSFVFGFIDAVREIPGNIERIAFIDSDYGYVDSMHQTKLSNWLKHKNSKLIVLAYNDRVVIYNGKPLVSARGGTWYRSRLMQQNLAGRFHFTTITDTAFIVHKALHERITMIFKENPTGIIYHTEQVARNGLILAIFSTTKFDHKNILLILETRFIKNTSVDKVRLI